MLEAEALSDAAFPEFGKKTVLFCHVTSRVDGEKYDKLLTEKGGRGFPYLVYMDADGGVLGSPAGRTVAAFDEGLATAQAAKAKRADLEKRAASGDKNAAAELLEDDLKSGRCDADAAKKRMAAMSGIDPAVKARLESRLLDAEVSTIVGKAKGPEDLPKIAEELKALKAAGRVPTGDSAQTFWSVLFQASLKAGDAKGAEEAIEGVRKLPEGQRRDQMLKMMEKQLDGLKNPKKDG
ncbi:MAG TPA: hypothetical protein VEI02_09325 [Planctomycetota bacterium]|nr:hypothetical protein [Planctomycetota bacterium]